MGVPGKYRGLAKVLGLEEEPDIVEGPAFNLIGGSLGYIYLVMSKNGYGWQAIFPLDHTHPQT